MNTKKHTFRNIALVVLSFVTLIPQVGGVSAASGKKTELRDKSKSRISHRVSHNPRVSSSNPRPSSSNPRPSSSNPRPNSSNPQPSVNTRPSSTNPSSNPKPPQSSNPR